MKPITPTQQRILDFIHTYWSQYHASPTLTEIQAKMGFKCKQAIHYHTKQLAKKGYISLGKRNYRNIKIR